MSNWVSKSVVLDILHRCCVDHSFYEREGRIKPFRFVARLAFAHNLNFCNSLSSAA